MIQEYEIEQKGGSVKYRLDGENAVLTGYSGKIIEVEIKDALAGASVIGVAKKAFLGAKSLMKVTLPGSIEFMEEWAFASCSQLKELKIIREEKNFHAISFAQGVFSKDIKLQKIDMMENDDISVLMGAAPVLLEADYLVDAMMADESDWYANWDQRMMEIMQEDDAEGYHKMVLCGEEDLDANIDEYKNMRQRRKCEIIFLRLLHDSFLDQNRRSAICDYLKAHTCGCTSQAAWEIIRDVHASDRDYCMMFLNLSMMDDSNFEKILMDLGDRYAEMKSLIMEYHDQHKKENSFFDSLEL